jgi:hypothetical protein
MYINYVWPKAVVVRSFLDAVPVECRPSEVVAHHSGIPVAMRRRIGRGGIIFLGSMLGPNLYAEEREARLVVTDLLSTRTVDSLLVRERHISGPYARMLKPL